ncbi:hypothetical protein [Streptococcus anginosus]|uniref:hypothetical protein n=1 Tax=Streptococcus anginosus TaxID=1328 RepID=UPI001245F799|nr:hypothetical protein [Streptococcus anginosus]KAA9305941.1 hypothetical protein F6I00_05665 [Streptococcus anginosus]KAA9315981.1 hypothetical protein F6H96_04365 [Streptococcus anginosus]MBS6902909.1 hypothetical protein [Streptococcus anginosus]MCW1005286.1 hypothetical protein [Streptococcus anginosus]MCW1090031.1 hypothetical protein [Streptococcus anginosus]
MKLKINRNLLVSAFVRSTILFIVLGIISYYLIDIFAANKIQNNNTYRIVQLKSKTQHIETKNEKTVYTITLSQYDKNKDVFSIPINWETYTKLSWYSSPLKGNFLSSTYVTYTSKGGFGTVDDKIHFISTAPELREKYAHSYCFLIMISYFLTITWIYIVESIDKARLAEDSELVKIYKEENK